MSEAFRTIVIDPPWPGPNAAWTPKGKDSLQPYTSMTGVQLAAMGLNQIAAGDAQLFLWTTSRNIGGAMLLMSFWSFTYRGLFVWKKPLGLGANMRHECEFLLWGARRGAPRIEPKQTPRQFHEWPRPRRHSEKPAEAYELIARLSPAPRIDIFARQSRPGFTAWGNEAP